MATQAKSNNRTGYGVDPGNPKDVEQVHALQNAIKVDPVRHLIGPS